MNIIVFEGKKIIYFLIFINDKVCNVLVRNRKDIYIIRWKIFFVKLYLRFI